MRFITVLQKSRFLGEPKAFSKLSHSWSHSIMISQFDHWIISWPVIGPLESFELWSTWSWNSLSTSANMTQKDIRPILGSKWTRKANTKKALLNQRNRIKKIIHFTCCVWKKTRYILVVRLACPPPLPSVQILVTVRSGSPGGLCRAPPSSTTSRTDSRTKVGPPAHSRRWSWAMKAVGGALAGMDFWHLFLPRLLNLLDNFLVHDLLLNYNHLQIIYNNL